MTMMKGFLIGLCLSGAAASAAACQDLGPGKAGIGLTLAATEYQIRDEVLNPIRHSGTSLTLEVFRRSGGEDRRRSVRFSLLVNPLGDRYTTERSSVVVHPAVDVRMAWRLSAAGENTSLFLGGSAGWGTHFQFHEQWDEQHVYWLTAAQSGLEAVVERRLGSGRAIHLEVGLPMVAVVSRPPERFTYREVDHGLAWILGEIHGRSRLATLTEYFAPHVSLTYSTVRNGRLRHSLFWRTNYIRNSAPTSRDVGIMSHSLGASMPWPF